MKGPSQEQMDWLGFAMGCCIVAMLPLVIATGVLVIGREFGFFH